MPCLNTAGVGGPIIQVPSPHLESFKDEPFIKEGTRDAPQKSPGADHDVGVKEDGGTTN
jgi:hypothetical protein